MGQGDPDGAGARTLHDVGPPVPLLVTAAPGAEGSAVVSAQQLFLERVTEKSGRTEP